MERAPWEYIKNIDNDMSPRFGHTITLATGSIPSPRAAHSSCCVNYNQLVVYGGATGAGGLAPDELYLLDLKNGEQNADWIVVPVRGQTPGRRYGHTLVFLKPYLILFGGNYGNEAANDVWIFNSESSPLQWSKLDLREDINNVKEEKIPSARVYHTASVCNYGYANGMMVIYGGRRKDGQVMNDMWGLRRHRNGTWDWTKAPYKGNPKDRLQHASLFCGNFFINIGGRSSVDGDNLPIEVYDTETSEWHTFMGFKRFRHACFIIENFMYIHGGLEDEKHNNPAKVLNEMNLLEVFEKDAVILPKLQAYLAEKKKPASPVSGSNSPNQSGARGSQGSERNSLGDKTNDKVLRLSDTVQVAANRTQDNNTDFNQIVREFSAKRLHGENVKQEDLMKMAKQPKEMEIHDRIISALLRPKEWIERQNDIMMEQDLHFDIEMDIVLDLISRCQKIVEEQPMVLRVDAPVKVFGDIHGQYVDLMRFFDLYSAPIEGAGGDIEGLDYIFLGDYVDRGTHSLETMCLLMALKVKYPNQMHLLRGNHEDRWINTTFGFQLELSQRANDDPDNPILFNAFNDFFDRLPLAAIVNDSVLCIHGGIGSSISSISDIEKIRRPLEVIHEVTNIDQQLVVDILWSDPTDSDIEVGIQPNITRDPTGVGNIVKFGPDRVNEFLKNNNLSLILRAHECVMDGFERFAGGQLITVFSATDYCGKHKNAGSILLLTNRFEIKPYLIYPNSNVNRNWDNSEETLKLRPPTPPRTRANTLDSGKSSANDVNRKNSFS